MSVSPSMKSLMQRAIVYGSHSITTKPDTTNNSDNQNRQSNPLTVSWSNKKISRPKKGQALIKVVCAGLNPCDAKNLIGDKLPHSWTYLHTFYHDKILAGSTIGLDFSGIIQDCPDGTFQPGDEVFGTMPPSHGTLAEYIVAPLDQVYYKSKQHSFAQAAALPLVGLTAMQALSPHVLQSKTNENERAKRASSVLIVGGSGGVGHVACQVARNLGAKHVTSICSARHEGFCKAHGASHVVDYHESSAELVKLLQVAPGCPFDVVLDCVTSSDPRDKAVHDYPLLLQDPLHELVNANNYVYTRLGGSFWDWVRADLRRTTKGVCNLFWGPEQLLWVQFPNSVDTLKQLVEWADAGLLTPHLHGVYDFTPEAVQQVFDTILSRRVQGKVVIRIDDTQDDNARARNGANQQLWCSLVMSEQEP